MYTIYAVIFSVANNISITMALPDKFQGYFECVYWASQFESSVNGLPGPVEVRAWECKQDTGEKL